MSHVRDSRQVLIVGAGLAGLCCARHLIDHGIDCLVLECSDGVGGRMRTDRSEGFLFDRGFQVLQSAYPEAQRMLDMPALDLRPFYPGALVRYGGRFHKVADPWRQPLDAIAGLLSPIGTFRDKVKIGCLRSRLLGSTLEEIFRQPNISLNEALRAEGFSPSMIERFLRPFFAGVFLERSLETSRRLFAFVFRMFAQGVTGLPANGMAAIPEQLAAGLGPMIRTGARVTAVDGTEVTLASGERLVGQAVVIATDGPAAVRLVPELRFPPSRSVVCLYFAAPQPPIKEPILILNGEGQGLINNMCVPSQVAPNYAPPNTALVSVTALGNPPGDDQSLAQSVRLNSPTGLEYRWRSGAFCDAIAFPMRCRDNRLRSWKQFLERFIFATAYSFVVTIEKTPQLMARWSRGEKRGKPSCSRSVLGQANATKQSNDPT